jgi:hypothetical protein
MASITTDTTTTPTTNHKRKLPFGHFKVDGTVIKPISQTEIAKGWQLQMPNFTKSYPIHHWSVTLAQLPPQLWNSVSLDYKNNRPFVPIIRDGNYFYSVSITNYDETFRNIYDELMKGYKADNNRLKELLSLLEQDITGWLIIRANEFIKGNYEAIN